MSPPPAALVSPPADVRAVRALHRVRAVLDRPTGELVAALLGYYATSSEECGTCFLDGTETCEPEAVTPADLFAVTALGLRVRPSAARRLLRDTPYAAKVARCLAPSRLPIDATPAEAGPALLEAMAELHSAVAAALDAPPDGSMQPLVSAVCARKRPELFPVLDDALCSALGLPAGPDPTPAWRSIHAVLLAPGIADALDALFHRARRAGVETDVYPLRQMHVLVGYAS